MRACRSRVFRVTSIVVLALAGTSCGGLLGGKERTPVAVYLLETGSAAAPAGSGGCGVLEVGAPDPAPGFATARMLYQREPHRLEPFAYARWAEPPAQMVQQAMIAALVSSGLFAAVLAAPAAVPPDLIVDSDAFNLIQRFDGGSSRTELTLNVRLVDQRASRLLAVRTLSASAPAGGDPAGGVRAANLALADVIGQLLEMTRASLDCGTASSTATQH
jgi:cholesterol transport system auxiliary component